VRLPPGKSAKIGAIAGSRLPELVFPAPSIKIAFFWDLDRFGVPRYDVLYSFVNSNRITPVFDRANYNTALKTVDKLLNRLWLRNYRAPGSVIDTEFFTLVPPKFPEFGGTEADVRPAEKIDSAEFLGRIMMSASAVHDASALRAARQFVVGVS
jgi:hypothetical protein